MTAPRILLDEHVGRVFERVLSERGHDVEQAKDLFGEHTDDRNLLAWCADEGVVLLSNNAKDFEPLHHEVDHAGILLYYDQKLPDTDPEGLARTGTKASISTEQQGSKTNSSISESGTTGSTSERFHPDARVIR